MPKHVDGKRSRHRSAVLDKSKCAIPLPGLKIACEGYHLEGAEVGVAFSLNTEYAIVH